MGPLNKKALILDAFLSQSDTYKRTSNPSRSPLNERALILDAFLSQSALLPKLSRLLCFLQLSHVTSE